MTRIYIFFVLCCVFSLNFTGCLPESDIGLLEMDGDETEDEASETDGDEMADGDPLEPDGDLIEGEDAEDESAEDEVEIDSADGETAAPARRGAREDLPEESVSCELACMRMDDCGHLDEWYALVADYGDCLLRCELADSLPNNWDTLAAENFKRCASVENDCEAVKYCTDWLNDPRSIDSCDILCYCVEGKSSESAEQGFKNRLPAPKGLSWAYETAVARPHISIDLDRLMADAADKLALESRGPFLRFKSRDLPPQTRLKSMGTALEFLPTFTDSAGHVLAVTEKMIISAKGFEGDLSAYLADFGLSRPTSIYYSKTRYQTIAASPEKALLAAQAINRAGRVQAEFDFVRFYHRRHLPDDPLFPSQWHLKNDSPERQVPGVDGRVWEAWDLTRGDPSVVIGVNDDGCDTGHRDLEDAMLDPLNFYEGWVADLNDGFGGHGTQVAGVAAAIGDNGLGVSGVCPACKIRCSLAFDPEGVYDPDSMFGIEDTAISGPFAAHADAGTAVVNNSWGIEEGDPLIWEDQPPAPQLAGVVADAFDYAEQEGRDGKGMLVVFAAGNGNQDVVHDQLAAYPTNVAVAAVGDQGLKSYYSAWGDEIDISAPSSGGLHSIVTTSVRGQGNIEGYNDYTAYFGGTSSASPFVSGVIGLILSANPELTAAECREILYKSARKIDPLFGRYDEEGRSVYYGFGMTDAYVAVAMAADPSCTNRVDCLGPMDRCGSAVDGDVDGDVDPDTDQEPDQEPDVDGDPEGEIETETSRRSTRATDGDLDDELSPEADTEVEAETEAEAEEEINCSRGACELCSDNSQCASGLCQAVSEIGLYVCLEACVEGACAADYTCLNDYCVPSRKACGFCDDEEICNGRDDDCDGQADGEGICKYSDGLCHTDLGCPEGQHCLTYYCEPECDSDEDCQSDDQWLACAKASYRYGAEEPDHKLCLPTKFPLDCRKRCGLILSDNSDQSLADVEECIMDQIDDQYLDCGGVFDQCMEGLAEQGK